MFVVASDRAALRKYQCCIQDYTLSSRAALGLPAECVARAKVSYIRVSVMHWRLEVINSIVQHNECLYGFWESHQQEQGSFIKLMIKRCS